MKIKNYITALIVIIIVVMGYLLLYQAEVNLSVEQIEQDPLSWVVMYTTPDTNGVSASTEHITDSNGIVTRDELYSLQRWVAQNIRYQLVDPTYPEQTLRVGAGSCWSQSSLLYSMILHEDADADSYIILIDLTTEVTEAKHSAVLTIFGGGLIVISDTTIGGQYINSICTLRTPQSAIETIISETTAATYDITAAVSLDESHSFSSNSEFYSFCGG